MDELFFGGIELGGTHTRCAVSDAKGNIAYQVDIPTTTPQETLSAALEFFKGCPKTNAIGIGAFGPLNLEPGSDLYGTITNTPKEGWENTGLKSYFEKHLKTRVFIQTDVNCAAIGEYFFGGAVGQANFLYMTVGTGIGAGIVVDGKIIQGQAHPEIGHMMIPHDSFADPFGGICPFHGNCFEGLASGDALEKRINNKTENVIDYRRWDLEALYLALGLHNLITSFSPGLIILGGGVIQHGGLVEQITRKVKNLMNGYLEIPKIIISTDNNAIKGAIKLASIGGNQNSHQPDDLLKDI